MTMLMTTPDDDSRALLQALAGVRALVEAASGSMDPETYRRTCEELDAVTELWSGPVPQALAGVRALVEAASGSMDPETYRRTCEELATATGLWSEPLPPALAGVKALVETILSMETPMSAPTPEQTHVQFLFTLPCGDETGLQGTETGVLLFSDSYDA